MQLSEGEWRERLEEKSFGVLRQGKTEPGGSGPLLYCFEDGAYVCAGCASPLFLSSQKYESGTGWPAFCESLPLELRDDPLYGMKRLEALCPGCGGHLGHLFGDLDSPTGKRFCINSAALEFRKGS